MDKVKHFLEVARKHHFWILCGLAALVGLIVMTISSGKLTAETEQRVKDIDVKLKAVTGITAPTPNESWQTGMTANANEARKSVGLTWTDVFGQQKREIFVWPTELGKDFIDEITKVENGKQAQMKPELRIRYLNQVQQLAKKLPKIVDAEPIPEPAAAGAVAPMPPLGPDGLPVFVDHKVVWDQASQQSIFATFTWFEAPSTAVLRQAQEELWVYEGLCKVIAEVNRTANGSHDAPITGIQELSIAYQAHSGISAGGMSGYGGMTRGVERAKGAATGGIAEMGGRPGAPPGGPEGAGPAAPPPDPKVRCQGPQAGGIGRPGLGAGPPAVDAAAPAGNPDDMWKGYRYVDETGKPLATAAEVDGSPLEFNLMPFKMRLTINPKDLDEFLIACRNSVLPIEVREIDLLGVTGGSTSSPAAPMIPMMPRGGPRGGGEEDGFRGGGGHMPPMMMPQGGGAGVPQQKTVQVEVAGVVYLLKTPDLTKLGPPPEGGAPAEGGTPPTPPENVTAPTPMPPQAMNVWQRKPIARSDAVLPASSGSRFIRRV